MARKTSLARQSQAAKERETPKRGPQIALGRGVPLLFPLALLAAIRGGLARVHEKEELTD